MILVLLAAAHAAVVATAPSPEAAAAFAPRRVAMLVGVEDYSDAALKGLRFPEKDARDLAAALGSPDIGGFDEVIVVTGDVATKRDALRKALHEATAKLQRNDTFLLYLSGHGTLTFDTDGSHLWFLPSDGRLDAPERTGLSVAELEDIVGELTARRRVLILDTCHNGRSGSKSSLSPATTARVQQLRGEPPAPRSVREVAESEARLYAAQYWQPAMEDPNLGNGVYTHFLLRGLTSARTDADLDKDGLVDVAEAHEYARDRTIAWTGGIQVPRAEYKIVGREEIYLSGKAGERNAAEQALVAAVDMVLGRAKLFVDGIPRGELPGLFAIEPGVKDVEVRSAEGRVLVKERLHLEAGESVQVEDLLTRKAPTVGVSLGTSYQESAGILHAVHPSLAVTWARPFRITGPWRPDLHASLDLVEGPLPDAPIATTGTFTAGATFGATLGRAWLGPTVDLRLPFREWGYADDHQLGATAAAGLSGGAGAPVTRTLALDLRVDGWGTALPFGGEWVPSWGAAARVGVAWRP